MNGLRIILPALTGLALCLLSALPAVMARQIDEDVARGFLNRHEANVRPLEVAASLAWWNANVTGKDEDFKRKEETQNRVDAALADPKAFSSLKALKTAKDRRG